MPDTDPIEGWIDTSTQGIAELISALESKWERAEQEARRKRVECEAAGSGRDAGI